MLVAAAGSSIYLLALLACPISMGAMMLFMGRGMMGGKARRTDGGGPRSDSESLEALKAEQERLAQRIAALDPSAPLRESALVNDAAQTDLEQNPTAAV